MFEIVRESVQWGDAELTLETGLMARQADGAVLAGLGDTRVLATVVSERTPRAGLDFFPLTVHYQEKTFAAGKIPGGYFKREGRPTEKEVLTSRLIDRPIRPLFAKGFKCETQVIATVLSHDLVNDPDIVAMIAVSAALTLSGVPFHGPIAAARVGRRNDEFVLNPMIEQGTEEDLNLIVAGTHDAVLMVESEARELSEDLMLEAVLYGHQMSLPVIASIIRLAERAAKSPRELPEQDEQQILDRVSSLAETAFREAYQNPDKMERQNMISAARSLVRDQLPGPSSTTDSASAGAIGDVTTTATSDQISSAMKALETRIVRNSVIESGKRIDGRGVADVRPISARVGILPRTHGSALFTRGETQALVVATLGTREDEQFVDALEGTYREHFLLHYNFPPYSVGETGRLGTPGRREVGHGKLAWRALHPMMPAADEFPYTIRLVSEITESNGSSSMATVCGASLALMDAGVPLSRPIAGIAMGLFLEADESVILSDILGDEDHLGDMDFKVAGTETGITSLQMDIKIAGITEQIMRTALAQAREGRLHILEEMANAISVSRGEPGEYAPRIEVINIPTDKIREVIGTGGKVIREITETTGAKIDINDDGCIKVASSDKESIEAAIKWIRSLTEDPEVNTIYQGTVVKIMDFGAFVNFFGNRDGLVHISQLASRRVEKTADVVEEGMAVKVKLIGIDDRGKMRLSMKVVDQDTGEDISDQFSPEQDRPSREDRSKGRRRREER